MISAAENHYAERVRQLLRLPVTRLSVAGAQHGYHHLTATLADGRAVFAKAVPGPRQSAAGPGQEASEPGQAAGYGQTAGPGLYREPAA